MKNLNLSCYNIKNENRTKFELFILKYANSIARKNRFGRATNIQINNKLNDPIRLVDANRPFYTTQSGRYVKYPNAYKRKAKSANLIYNSAYCDMEINPKLIAIQEFGELI